jgi:hypothetical protein
MGIERIFFKFEGELYPETEEPIIEITFSISPEDRLIVPAYIVEGKDGKAYLIRKNLRGEIEKELYWSDAKLLREIQKYKPFRDEIPINCPNECAIQTPTGLCYQHKSKTALANLVVTNRCDLACWYCFFYEEPAGYVYEPSLADIKKMLEFYKVQNISMAIQITGGEPLLREDIVDIVKLLKEEGVSHIQLNTNGIRFSYANGAKLARELRRAGVNTIYISFDGLKPETNPKNHWEFPYTL